MADPKISNTSKVGYAPNIQQPVKEVTLDIGDGTVRSLNDGINLSDFRGPNQVNQIAPEDQALIAEYMGEYTNTKAQLDDFDRRLDAILADLAIPYDPTKFPEFADAHHHVCGRPGALNVITYPDIRNRMALEKRQLAAALAVPSTLDEMAENDSRGLSERANTKTGKMIQDMLKQVAKEILIIVLEFSEKMFAPLKGIKFIKAIPRLFTRAIARLRGRNVDPATIGSFLQDVKVGEEGELTSEELAQAGGGYISSIKEITQAVVEELPPQCLQHTSTWNNVVEEVIRDTNFAPAYYAKRSNIFMQARLETVNKLAGVGIPEGHVATVNGTALTYTNPLPEEYVRARADGSTRFGAISQGLTNSVRAIGSTFVPRMERILKNLTEDPTLLCCLIRNLVLLATMKKLRKVLLYIQALLMLWRNLLALDISKELARMGNLIIDLVNRLLQAIFSLYTTFFYSQLSSFALKVKDLIAIKQISAECRPWSLLIDLAAEILSEMIDKVFNYLTGFFTSFNLDIKNINLANDKIEKLAQIDRLLRIVNKIIQFNAAWAACVENDQDPLVILKGQDRVQSQGNTININRFLATRLSEGIGINSEEGGLGAPEPGEIGSTQNGFSQTGPTSRDGVQILLTNFIGVSAEGAHGIMDSIEDCSCDKSLTPEELSAIERILKE